MAPKLANKSAGFSVVEMLITLFIVTLAAVLLTNMYASATVYTDRATDLLTANALAYQKLQNYENRDFAAIPFKLDGTPVEDFSAELPPSLPPPHEGKVFISQQSATLKYIFVRVKYGSGGGAQTIEYGDFVQSGGLGR
ncbi:MAG: hypothetical protein EOT04_00520 [Candidatus Chaera renei]|uniref:Prepilin-type N-terminal cleavage/methylation domain-containing protein n=1 Tax=Candidatus Chaera renei TaxID=2506947 RepID=A0A4V1J7P8_9BACT|nr:MAG: hypothetical protein EOT04_00520 [Candidatus Chaera renei]